jgi:D-hydroxyproline dehydrogenase subunit beta
LRAGLAGALSLPGDCVLDAQVAARWLVEQSVERGATLRLGERVTAVPDAGLTICASGTWATELFPWLPIRPRKGHVAITDRAPGFVHHELIELGYLKSAHGHASESVAFNVQPKASGQVLIGSSRQYGQTNAGIETPIRERMLQRAIEYMPGLANLSIVRTWTGFRAATDDKLPIIGPCPGRRGVYLATGHEGLGITTSLATAQLIADAILGRTPAIPAEPYLPSRVAGSAA